MKTLKITTDNTIRIVDIDFSDYREIKKGVGGFVEMVKTKWIWSELGEGALMLVDEEGWLKKLPMNKTGSLLYGAHVHGNPIVGDILLAVATPDGENFIAPDEERLIEWKEKLKADFMLKEVQNAEHENEPTGGHR